MLGLSKISTFLRSLKNRFDLYSYRRKLPVIVDHVRNKERIKILFMLSDLSLWKTESLYRAMMNHPRFEPILGLTLLTCDVPSEIIRKYEILTSYLKNKGYIFKEISSESLKIVNPDIVFYQQPYDGFISNSIDFYHVIKNKGLICDVHYAFRTLAVRQKNWWVIDLPLYRYCWQIYLENRLNLEYTKISLLRGKNLVVTGLPFQDELQKPEKLFNDPWKPQTHKKKRIIYAPHHTLPDFDNLINLSCFLDVCDYMFEIANEYSNDVQFAFKPHPFLKRKLVNLWGKEKTERYYSRWNELENCQLVEGSYIELFKHSDALIHDCDSFTVEYCFTKKPIMYLISPDRIENRRNDLNQFGLMAFNLHEFGFTKEDIKSFVSSVVKCKDPKLKDREFFYQKYLLPPHGQTAVDNIINSILGN